MFADVHRVHLLEDERVRELLNSGLFCVQPHHLVALARPPDASKPTQPWVLHSNGIHLLPVYRDLLFLVLTQFPRVYLKNDEKVGKYPMRSWTRNNQPLIKLPEPWQHLEDGVSQALQMFYPSLWTNRAEHDVAAEMLTNVVYLAHTYLICSGSTVRGAPSALAIPAVDPERALGRD